MQRGPCPLELPGVMEPGKSGSVIGWIIEYEQWLPDPRIMARVIFEVLRVKVSAKGKQEGWNEVCGGTWGSKRQYCIELQG